MAENFYKLSNSEFIIWMKNMLTMVENNSVANIEAGLITQSKGIRTNLEANLSEKLNLEENLAGKSLEIKFNRKEANKNAAKIRDSLRLNSNVATGFIEIAGFNVVDGVKTTTAPVAPTDLVVTGTSDGINKLTWKRNGNKQGTLFMIEARSGDSGAWLIIDTVTNTKYEHKNQVPGVKIQYRIKAKRGTKESTASNMAVVYG